MGVEKKCFMGSPPAYLRDGSGSPDSVLTDYCQKMCVFVFNQTCFAHEDGKIIQATEQTIT